MKWLKTYGIFETTEHRISLDEIKSDITEICYDLTDFGKFQINILKDDSFRSFPQDVYTVTISKNEPGGFLLSEVSEVLIRLKSYIGIRKYTGCTSLLLNSNKCRLGLKNISDIDKIKEVYFHFTD